MDENGKVRVRTGEGESQRQRDTERKEEERVQRMGQWNRIDWDNSWQGSEVRRGGRIKN